jgi:3-phenylpropionate/trans-cinnamate dioxygenase ferredoxin subunit
MSFERACAVSDVPTDEPLGVTIGAYDVVIARCEDGEIFALQDLCSHAAVALSEGEVGPGDQGECTVECWLHGSRFDLRTGKPTGLPATEPVATFPLEVRANADGTSDIYVDTTTTLNGVTPT